jgi:XTP/dITP diphosphohydrolase
MIKKLVFSTNNEHKLDEVRAIVSDKFQIVSLKQINCTDDIPETAATLEGNALLKAQYVHANFGFDCFADDTGLEVEALNGAPGVFSARYAGEGHDFAANMQKLLLNMETHENRKAQFRTVICLIINEKTYFFEGAIKGTIARKAQGKGGFGYDPVFIPQGYAKSFAELGNDEKNEISHRALATKKMSNFLDNF